MNHEFLTIITSQNFMAFIKHVDEEKYEYVNDNTEKNKILFLIENSYISKGKTTPDDELMFTINKQVYMEEKNKYIAGGNYIPYELKNGEILIKDKELHKQYLDAKNHYENEFDPINKNVEKLQILLIIAYRELDLLLSKIKYHSKEDLLYFRYKILVSTKALLAAINDLIEACVADAKPIQLEAIMKEVNEKVIAAEEAEEKGKINKSKLVKAKAEKEVAEEQQKEAKEEKKKKPKK